MSDGEKAVVRIKPRMRKAIFAVLSHSTITAALGEVGISKSTFYKWLRDIPAFRQALDTERAHVFAVARSELESAFSDSVAVLRKGLTNTDPSERRLCATAILSLVIKLREIDSGELAQELLIRLEELTG